MSKVVFHADTVLHYVLLADPYEGIDWSVCSGSCGGGVRSRSIATADAQQIECNLQSCEEGVYPFSQLLRIVGTS